MYLGNLIKCIKKSLFGESSSLVGKTTFSSDQIGLLSEISVHFNLTDLSPELFNETIKKLGEFTDVSRVYIFLDSPNGKLMTNEYEWTAEGVEPQMQNLQNLPYKSLPSLKKHVYDEGILLSTDVSTLEDDLKAEFESENIKSILILPLFVSLLPIGFIGFDETRRYREWTDSEVNMLRVVAGIMGNAFARFRTEKLLQSKVDELQKLTKLLVGRELDMAKMKEKLNQRLEDQKNEL